MSGGSLARTPCCQSRGPGFDPWSENYWVGQKVCAVFSVSEKKLHELIGQPSRYHALQLSARAAIKTWYSQIKKNKPMEEWWSPNLKSFWHLLALKFRIFRHSSKGLVQSGPVSVIALFTHLPLDQEYQLTFHWSPTHHRAFTQASLFSDLNWDQSSRRHCQPPFNQPLPPPPTSHQLGWPCYISSRSPILFL